MTPTTFLQVVGFEDNSVFVMARILGHAGVNITQASLTSIACKVYDGTTEVAAPAVVVADSVFDALQTSDPRWTKDATGYNFAFTVPASAFPSGDKVYLVKFTFDPVTGDNFNFAVKNNTVELPGQ